MMLRVITCFALFCLSAPTSANDLRLITLGAGEVAGSYFASARAICESVNRAQRGGRLRCSPDPTAGSVYNLRALREGQLDFALIQSDWQRRAYEGSGYFAAAGPMKDLRSVAGLYPEAITILVRKDAEIVELADLKGKRIDIGHPASGRRATNDRFFQALNLSATDFAMVAELTVGGAIQEICAGRIDATVLVVGHPNATIAKALTRCGATLIPARGPQFDDVVSRDADYSPVSISSTSYPNLDAHVPTFAVIATLVTRSSTEEVIVRAVVKAILGQLPQLAQMAPVLGSLSVHDLSSRGLTAPLHPGAKSAFDTVLMSPSPSSTGNAARSQASPGSDTQAGNAK
ncbi:MAG: TAXI family TRAP transporter solute-binding subunit [Hyphomicrobiaceae bacterium]